MSKLLGLSNGKAIDPYRYVPSKDFDPKVVAKSLAHICRFNGQQGWMTVAEHCVITSNIMGFRWDALPDLIPNEMRNEWRLFGLLHDSTEAVFGDITSPVKAHQDFRYLRALENEYLDEIYVMHNLRPNRQIIENIHVADRYAMSIEIEALGKSKEKYWEYQTTTYPRNNYPKVVGVGYERDEAEELWLRTYESLITEVYYA